MTVVHFDKILERLGPWGKYQIFTYILIGLAGLPTGTHNLLNFFIAATPEHWCHIPELQNVSLDQHKLFSIYPEYGSKMGACSIYDIDYKKLANEWNTEDGNLTISNLANTTTSKRSCSSWVYSQGLYTSTTVSKWNLVCDSSWKKAASQSIYMFGFLTGTVLFGSISDRYGRKLSWFIAMASLVLVGLPATFTPEYWSHVWLRFIQGNAAAGVFTCGFVLVMEIIGVEKRMIPGIFYQGWFAAGYIATALVSYFVRTHTWLMLIASVYPVVFISYWWIIGESPRWLLSQGRTEEAIKEIKKAAKMNNIDFPDDLLSEQLTPLDKLEKENEKPRRTYTMLDLVRTPNMRKKSLNCFYNWFVNSFVYYGLSMGASDLAGSPHLNLVISGVAEFFGFFVAIATLDRIGRRWPLAMLLIVAGVACVITTVIPPHLWMVTTAFSMLGKLCISGSFAVIYVYSAELFPTVVRNLGVGVGSMFARIGGLVAPFVMLLGDLWTPLPFIVMGACSILAGCLTFLFPETLHAILPETIEDGEEFGKKPSTDKIGMTNGDIDVKMNSMI